MMRNIYFRATAEIHPPFDTVPDDGPFQFTVSDSAFAGPLTIVVDATGTEIMSSAQGNVTDDLYQSLTAGATRDELTPERETELADYTFRLSARNKSVLRLLQQELHKYKPHELFNGHAFWADDGTKWNPIRGGNLGGAIRAEPLFRLDEKWNEHVQSLLDAGEEALLATQHLHEAERAHGKRFSRIEATIAAELAIKEMLVRFEPRLKTLLLEVPSPPLKKLYGEVLEAVVGERSPYRKAIDQGSVRRNDLVHRPQPVELGAQEVVDYLQTVRSAIEHLLRLHRNQCVPPSAS